MRDQLRPLGWQDVAGLARARIRARDWAPGRALPPGATLAREFGVSRATVDRALRALAEEGLLERRRGAPTRVAERPVRRVTLALPLPREAVEAAGRAYGYRLLDRALLAPPAGVMARLGLRRAQALWVEALHLADGAPWAHEGRWIDPGLAPGAAEADFGREGAGEWLAAHVAADRVELEVLAERAEGAVARALGCEEGEAVLVQERVERLGAAGVTLARLSHAPGHRLDARGS